MKQINLKYSFNKTYYYNKPISVPTMVECLYCENGYHTRVKDRKVVLCPLCNGDWIIDTGHGSIREEPSECFLAIATSIVTKDNERTDYVFRDGDGKRVRATIYDSIEECIKGKTKGIMGYSSPEQQSHGHLNTCDENKRKEELTKKEKDLKIGDKITIDGYDVAWIGWITKSSYLINKIKSIYDENDKTSFEWLCKNLEVCWINKSELHVHI